MPTINIISTCVTNSQTDLSGQLPFTFNDIFPVESPIHFGFNLSYLNELRTAMSLSTISSSDITTNSKSLIVFLCGSINGSNVFQNISKQITYNLTSSNLDNNFLSQNLSTSTGVFNIVNDDFLESLTQEEIYGLCKEYQIIFRITPTSAPVTLTSIQNGDIIHDFKLMIDINQAGPYDVNIENVDIMNPSEFSTSQLLEIYTNNTSLVGHETQRFFYPKNIKSLSALPIIVISHGQNHNSLMYDAYASIFASFGYCVISISREIGNTTNRVFALLRHLKMYLPNIKQGYFNNTINFNKIGLVGHSVGGGTVLCVEQDVYNNVIYPSVSGLTGSDFMFKILLEPSSGGCNSATPAPNNWLPTLNISSNDDGYGNPGTLGYNNNKFITAIKTQIGGHEFISEAFSSSSASAQAAPINAYDNSIAETSSYITNNRYTFNNHNTVLKQLGQQCVIFIAQITKKKIINYYINTNKSYLSTKLKNNNDLINVLYKKDSTVPGQYIFIDKFNNTNLFTSNIGSSYSVQSYSFFINDNLSIPNKSLGYLMSTFHFTQTTAGYTFGLYLFPYNNANLFINYNLNSSPLNLSGNSYISVAAGTLNQISNTGSAPYLYGSEFNEAMYQNFTLQLLSGTTITSEINSKQNNLGIPISCGQVTSKLLSNNMALLPTRDTQAHTNINFKVSDFKTKNPNLDLTNITGMKLLFGSTYGTTSGYNGLISLNALYVS